MLFYAIIYNFGPRCYSMLYFTTLDWMLFYAIFYNYGPRCYSMLYFTILDLDVILCYILQFGT